MDYKKTRWRDITHELTGQVQFRPENSRRPLNIPIREIQKKDTEYGICLLYTSQSQRDISTYRKTTSA